MQEKIFRLAIRGASTLAPKHTARWAAKLFFSPRQRHTRHPEVLPTADYEQAINGAYLRRWGTGNHCVFLLHGWEGRHSQFHALIPALRQAGHSVVTIDPPGHGRGPGKQSNPRLFAEALLSTAAHLGQPAAVVGHSMGGAAAMLAIKQGLSPKVLVLISSPSNVRSVIAGFSQFLSLTRHAETALCEQIEQEVGLPLQALDAAELAQGGPRPSTLIIHDHDDRFIPPQHAKDIAQHWPSSTLHMSEGLGHQRLLTDETLIKNIRHFVSRQLAPAVPA